MCAVFMKDVSKQTLHDLMTFIYRGEVNVTRANLEHFLNTAKVLKIKGLTDECPSHAFEYQTSTPSCSTPAHNGCQFQSSHTIRIQSPANEQTFSDSVLPSYQQPQQQQRANDFYQQIDFEYNAGNPGNSMIDIAECHFDDDFYGNDMANGNPLMAKARIPKVKRVKRINSELIIIFHIDYFDR